MATSSNFRNSTDSLNYSLRGRLHAASRQSLFLLRDPRVDVPIFLFRRWEKRLDSREHATRVGRSRFRLSAPRRDAFLCVRCLSAARSYVMIQLRKLESRLVNPCSTVPTCLVPNRSGTLPRQPIGTQEPPQVPALQGTVVLGQSNRVQPHEMDLMEVMEPYP